FFAARAARLRVIDLPPAVRPVHQRHDYDSAGGHAAVFGSDDARRNIALSRATAGEDQIFNLDDATHVLSPRGFEPAWRVRGPAKWLKSRVWRFPALHPATRPLFRAARAAYGRVRPARLSGRMQHWWVK